MFKLVFTLYAVCYACFIFYTREPDYFDREIAKATIAIKNKKAIAFYNVDAKTYSINADYILKSWKNNESTDVIYNPAHPEKACVYSIWGYWFTWGELLLSSVLLFFLYQLALSITKNPAENNGENEVVEKERKYV